MKHCSENEKTHELLDEELNEAEKAGFEKHLALCSECRKSLDSIRRMRALLSAQPPILPGSSFDNKILRLIDKKTEKTEAKKGFLSVFSGFPLKFGFAALIAIIALGVAFQLGRMSVVSISQDNAARNSPAQKDSNFIPAAEKQSVSPPPAERIVTQIKTVTKYVPVIKKVKEEKIVYVNDSKSIGSKIPVVPKREAEINEEITAKYFNLTDLQPVGEISYRIIKKGVDNE